MPLFQGSLLLLISIISASINVFHISNVYLWCTSCVFLFLSAFSTVSSVPTSVTSTASPLGNRTVSPPEGTVVAVQSSGQTPMAALMSVADSLPPGSPRNSIPENAVNGGSRPGSAARHSPNGIATGESGKSFQMALSDSSESIMEHISFINF